MATRGGLGEKAQEKQFITLIYLETGAWCHGIKWGSLRVVRRQKGEEGKLEASAFSKVSAGRARRVR